MKLGREAINWSRGERITAEKLNRVSSVAQGPVNNGITPVQVLQPSRMEWLEVVSIDNPARLMQCKLYGDTSGSPVLYTVDLPPIFTEASRGAVSYTYTDLNNRTAQDGSDTESQRITPEFIVGDYLRAELTRFNDRYRFIGDGRMWAKV